MLYEFSKRVDREGPPRSLYTPAYSGIAHNKYPVIIKPMIVVTTTWCVVKVLRALCTKLNLILMKAQ